MLKVIFNFIFISLLISSCAPKVLTTQGNISKTQPFTVCHYEPTKKIGSGESQFAAAGDSSCPLPCVETGDCEKTSDGGLYVKKQFIELATNEDIADAEPIVRNAKANGFSIYPELPEGFTFDSNTGRISGKSPTPLAMTTYLLSADLTDKDPDITVWFNPIKIAMGVNLESTRSSLEDDTGVLTYPDTEYTFYLNQEIEVLLPTLQGGFAKKYSIDPELPSGLSLNEDFGTISGTPETESELKDYTVNATFSKPSDLSDKEFNVTTSIRIGVTQGATP